MRIQKFKKPPIDKDGNKIPKYLFDGEKNLFFAKFDRKEKAAITIKGLKSNECFKIIKNFHYYNCGINPNFIKKVKTLIYFWKWLNIKI